MNDLDSRRTDDADLEGPVHGALAAIMDTAPAARTAPTDLNLLDRYQPGYNRPRVLVGAAVAAVLVVGVGGLAFLANRSASEPAASATTPDPTASAAPTTSSLPPTAGVTGDGRGDRWTTAVQDVLDQLGWELAGTEYSADGGNIFGGSVVAEVGDSRIVFDVQTYADGEYSTDPNWQMEVAGSNTPGTAVPEGTLFLTDETATAVRRAIVVSPSAIVMVHAEFVATSDLPDIATFETAARQLAARLPDVLGNDN